MTAEVLSNIIAESINSVELDKLQKLIKEGKMKAERSGKVETSTKTY